MAAAPTLEDPRGWGRLIGGWWSRLWNPDRGKQSAGSVSGGSASGVTVTDQRAMQVAAVFSCIRLISEITASLPLPVYRRLPDGTREVAQDHWLSKLLTEPNPLMTGQELREALGAGLAGWGNAYVQRVNSGSGRVVQLWPLKPDFMQVDRTDLDRIEYRYNRVGTNSGPETLQQEEVLHVKGFGLDGVMGLAPLAMARQALGLAISAEDYAASFYRNGGKPSGVLMVDRLLQPEQRQKIEEKFAGIASGDSNRLWVLEAAMQYQQITIPPEDAQMLQTRQFELAEIARFFRVPLFLLMEMEKSTSWGSGLEQQNLAFLAYSLRPYLTRIEKSINRWLLSPAERQIYYVEHNVEALLRTDSAARAQFYSTMVQNGLMTRNEVRTKENLPPMDGGNQLTVQTNLTPAEYLASIANKTSPKGADSLPEA